mmetsp:Transcript_920/g.3378  ORF Transcript_920/g.3378 Transcript_920/m.3378 type:complete len:97 (-) Transcript_920:19-309(-)
MGATATARVVVANVNVVDMCRGFDRCACAVDDEKSCAYKHARVNVFERRSRDRAHVDDCRVPSRRSRARHPRRRWGRQGAQHSDIRRLDVVHPYVW